MCGKAVATVLKIKIERTVGKRDGEQNEFWKVGDGEETR